MACNEERKVGQGVGREGWDVVRGGFSRDRDFGADPECCGGAGRCGEEEAKCRRGPEAGMSVADFRNGPYLLCS